MILKVMLDFDFEGYAGILVALQVMLGFDAFEIMLEFLQF